MFCREFIERIVKDCFASYGGSCLDTPVFERKDILTGKYGQDAKLIYDLMDQGGEQLALRYDHTVSPFPSPHVVGPHRSRYHLPDISQ